MSAPGTDVRFHRVVSNGVVIHVEERGHGNPVVAMGGIASAALSTIEFADVVSAQHRLISYDRRDTYRSSDSPTRAVDADDACRRQADDVINILDALDTARCSVLATCAGASIALELMCRHPERITAMVIHDPLTVAVLPDPQAEIAALMKYHHASISGGGAAGMRAFLTDHGLPFPDDFAVAAEREATRGGVLSEMVEAINYTPRTEDLREHRPRIAVAASVAGLASDHVYARTAVDLATRLDIELSTLPGNHSAYFSDAGPFADAALTLLHSVTRQR